MNKCQKGRYRDWKPKCGVLGFSTHLWIPSSGHPSVGVNWPFGTEIQSPACNTQQCLHHSVLRALALACKRGRSAPSPGPLPLLCKWSSWLLLSPSPAGLSRFMSLSWCLLILNNVPAPHAEHLYSSCWAPAEIFVIVSE